MKTRFAPSPTGPFHIGSLRTALLVKLWAQKLEGQAILRLEDTDTKRSTKEYENEILTSLSLNHLEFKPPYPRQSERLERYAQITQALLDNGLAYRCYMTSAELDALRADITARNAAHPTLKLPVKYDNRFRPENYPNGVPPELKRDSFVVRIQLPTEGSTQWIDASKGKIEVPNSQLDDLIIARSEGSPTYNFAVVVDDLDMGITHVVRGDDHVSNTPKQIQIAKLLRSLPEYQNCEDITYCHVPLMFNPDGTKISKSALADPANAEKVAAGQVVPAALKDYRVAGILPEALVNYLLLISAQKTAEIMGTEIFTYEEFLKYFELSHLSKTAAHFDMAKLYDINTQHIAKKSYGELKDLTLSYAANFAAPDMAVDISALVKADLSAIHAETQKRSKSLKDTLEVYTNTLLAQETLKNYDLQSAEGALYQSLLSATDAVAFKDILTQHAKAKGVKFGVVAHALRENLNIKSGLPLFELFEALKANWMQKNLNNSKFKIS